MEGVNSPWKEKEKERKRKEERKREREREREKERERERERESVGYYEIHVLICRYAHTYAYLLAYEASGLFLRYCVS